jgi:hypothetical protein
LCLTAAGGGEEPRVRARLNTLGNDLDAEGVPEVDGCPNHGSAP